MAIFPLEIRHLRRLEVSASLMGIRLASAAFGAFVSEPVSAQVVASQSSDEIASAKELFVAGERAKARAILEKRLIGASGDVEALFLLGMIAMADVDYRQAIVRFHQALVHQPGAPRIRLELARAYFLAKRYEDALRQFQFARAGNPPDAVIVAIEQYISAIRANKARSYSFNLALAPDSNINNATSSTETELFGLPFEIDDKSRKRSGIGIAVGGSYEFAPRLTSTSRLRLGVAVQRREYSGRSFDDTSVAIYVGPRISRSRSTLGLSGLAFRRWFGTRRLNEGYGVRAEATWDLDARTALSLDVSGQSIRYPDIPLQTGHAAAASVGVVRALSASSTVLAQMGVNRFAARADDLSSWSGVARAGYYRDLRGGYSLYVEPGFTYSRFDAADPFFGKVRQDNLMELQLALLNRRVVILSRFTPRIAYTVARRRSTINLYTFNQNRLEIGLTSSF